MTAPVRWFKTPEAEHEYRARTFLLRVQDAVYNARLVVPNSAEDIDDLPGKLLNALSALGLKIAEVHIPHCGCPCHDADEAFEYHRDETLSAYRGCNGCTRDIGALF